MLPGQPLIGLPDPAPTSGTRNKVTAHQALFFQDTQQDLGIDSPRETQATPAPGLTPDLLLSKARGFLVLHFSQT